MKGILYYSSNSGNTLLVGEAIQEAMRKLGISLKLQNIAENDALFSSKSLDVSPLVRTSNGEFGDGGYNFMLIACGTYGHGQLEKNMNDCLDKTWKDANLRGIPCAAVGLGDTRYEREYCLYSALLLETWLADHGGKLLVRPLRINRSPVKPTNQTLIIEWVKEFVQRLRE